MNNTKSSVTGEVVRQREEVRQHLVAIDRRLTSIERYIRQCPRGGCAEGGGFLVADNSPLSLVIHPKKQQASLFLNR